jgi:predicted DNA-binding protein
MADAAYERIRQGSERTYTSAEVRRELGLDD